MAERKDIRDWEDEWKRCIDPGSFGRAELALAYGILLNCFDPETAPGGEMARVDLNEWHGFLSFTVAPVFAAFFELDDMRLANVFTRGLDRYLFVVSFEGWPAETVPPTAEQRETALNAVAQARRASLIVDVEEDEGVEFEKIVEAYEKVGKLLLDTGAPELVPILQKLREPLRYVGDYVEETDAEEGA